MKKLFTLFAAAAVLLLCSCTAISETEEAVPAAATAAVPQPYPVAAGNLIFNSSPVTVGSLSPAVTEMIYELGYGDRLICRSSYCDTPEEVLSLPDGGSAANPDIDSIISYAPELLITQSPIANKDTVRLSEAGISLLTLPAPSSLEELYDNYAVLADIFAGSTDGPALAENTLADMKAAVKEAENSCESLVFIMGTDGDVLTAGTGDSFAGDLFSVFGHNIAEKDTDYTITSDELIKADPQFIFLARPLSAEDFESELSEQLSAFSEGRVFSIDASLTERPTARLAETIRPVSRAMTDAETVTATEFTGGYAEIPDSSEE